MSSLSAIAEISFVPWLVEGMDRVTSIRVLPDRMELATEASEVVIRFAMRCLPENYLE